MNKKLLALLDKINEKKTEVQNLCDAGKLEEAKTAKAELVKMQDEFDILKDVLDSAAPAPTNKKPISDPVDETDAHKFANAARMGFKNIMTEGTPADGGYTVPEDVRTQVNHYRDVVAHLSQFVTTETVSTKSGARTYQTRAKINGFNKIGEGGKIGASNTPQFKRITYSIDKFGGYLPVTNELLADSDANINSTIAKWLGDGSRVTRNREIVTALETDKTRKVVTTLDDLTKILNIDLGSVYKPTSKIFTNDYGIHQLGLYKDANGRSLLQPSPTEPTKMQISAGANVIEVITLPVKDLPNVTVEGQEHAPIIIGDLKEAVTLYDRQKITVASSNIAVAGDLNAFEEDLTLFKALERFDVKVKDSDAYVLGYFAPVVETVEALG